jgi:YVTN family beta-propeller protein
VATLSTGYSPTVIAADPVADAVYVGIPSYNQMIGINGSTDAVASSVGTGTYPVALAADSLTNVLYAANKNSDNVTVILGLTSAIEATVPVGSVPVALAVNPATNKIYVVNQAGNNVTIINGSPLYVPMINTSNLTSAIAVNPATDKIYVSSASQNSAFVIDGATNTVAPLSVVGPATDTAVNPATNKIYVTAEAMNSVSVVDGSTDTLAKTVTVGTAPVGIAVDPVSDKIYVANWCGNATACLSSPDTVSVIDGSSDTVTATIPVGFQPKFVAVDSATDRIYAVNLCGADATCQSAASVSVIDGATNTVTATVPVGWSPSSLAVDTLTDKIYVANSCGNDSACASAGTVSIIDGATNSVAMVTVGFQPVGIAANAVSDEIYVVNNCASATTCGTQPGTVSVIDGTNDSVASTVTVGNGPDSLSVDPANNEIYVLNSTDGTISEIDGASSVLSRVVSPTFGSFSAVAVDPVTGMAYGGNSQYEIVNVINGEALQTIPLSTTIAGFTGGVTTNHTPTFSFTTDSSSFLPATPPIQHVYYQVDTKQGPWLPATGSAPSFTGVSPKLSLGTHVVYAYATDGQDATSTGPTQDLVGTISSQVFTVIQSPSTTSLSADSTSVVAGNPVVFTASVTSTASGTPTGTVTFFDGPTVLGTGTLDSSGAATFTTSTLAVGSHSITAIYEGDSNFASSTSSTANEQILATTTTTLSPIASASYGESLTLTATVKSSSSGTPTGSVTFMDGTTTLGTGTLNSSGVATFTTSLLAVGSHSLTASYSGEANFATSTSSTLSLTVNPAATSASVSASANPSYSGAAVTFTAAITSSGGAPTGTVTFNDGSTKLGTATLDSAGHATYTTSTLSVGSHSITAAYGGNADFASSTSAALTETVNTASFTLSIPNASATVQAGQSATFAVTVSPEGDMTNAISFACSGLPSKSTCSFSPGTVTPGTTATKDTLTISTTATTTAALWPLAPTGHPTWPLFAALALLPALALLATRKRQRPARRKLRRLAWAGTLAVCLAMTLAACGGGGGSSSSSGSTPQTIPGTPAGTYSVTVTGTSGSENITAKVNLTVQ